ncbi:MAG: electron transfer flavoprotein subunit beta/FixA family protein [candidate division WOR-3 bacterium]|nr:electron transfer flavoprotein subunit beta/FixA family protein [candidate division WOR-3 bacterium]
MNIIVCIKRVPQTAEADVKVDSTGRDIIKDRLAFDMNESDSYALEEGILLKEKYGGTVTVISLGYPETEDTLRIAMAKGGDTAIRIKQEEFGDVDGYKTAKILSAVIKDLNYDLILTGCMASDDAYSMVGQTLAELLGIPHATLVTKLEISDKKVQVHRELEGGLLEHLELSLPAVITIQTGINTPRFASLIAIRRAASKEIKMIGKGDLSTDIDTNATLEELFLPPVGKRAEIIIGSADEVATKIAGIIKEKGLL